MWRLQAAIFRRTAFGVPGQACDLGWLPVTHRRRALRTGAVQVFPAMEGHIEQARAGLREAPDLRFHRLDKHPGDGGEPLVDQPVEGHLTPPLLPGVLPGTHDPLEGAVPQGWRGQK